MTMNSVYKSGSLILAILLISGCASIMEGNDQTINVNTSGCEQFEPMRCTVSNDSGSSVLTAPASVSIEKDRDAMTISCESKGGSATGRLVVDSGYEAMNAGNILLGGIIGIGVDAATGAMWKYPAAVVVPMTCDSQSGSSESSESGFINKIWPDGRVYVGTAVNDLPDGQGVLTLANGDKYKGSFSAGLYDGIGSYTWNSGKEYRGEFMRGLSKGQGIIKFTNGDEYRGSILDGNPHGQGVMKYWSGKVGEGIWLEGILKNK